jgi:hypothetical protein
MFPWQTTGEIHSCSSPQSKSGFRKADQPHAEKVHTGSLEKDEKCRAINRVYIYFAID